MNATDRILARLDLGLTEGFARFVAVHNPGEPDLAALADYFAALGADADDIAYSLERADWGWRSLVERAHVHANPPTPYTCGIKPVRF